MWGNWKEAYSSGRLREGLLACLLKMIRDLLAVVVLGNQLLIDLLFYGLLGKKIEVNFLWRPPYALLIRLRPWNSPIHALILLYRLDFIPVDSSRHSISLNCKDY